MLRCVNLRLPYLRLPPYCRPLRYPHSLLTHSEFQLPRRTHTMEQDVAQVLMAVFLHDIDLLGPFQAQIWLGVNVKIAFNTLVRDN